MHECMVICAECYSGLTLLNQFLSLRGITSIEVEEAIASSLFSPEE